MHMQGTWLHAEMRSMLCVIVSLAPTYQSRPSRPANRQQCLLGIVRSFAAAPMKAVALSTMSSTPKPRGSCFLPAPNVYSY